MVCGNNSDDHGVVRWLPFLATFFLVVLLKLKLLVSRAKKSEN